MFYLFFRPKKFILFLFLFPLFFSFAPEGKAALSGSSPHSLSLSVGQIWSAGNLSRDASSTVGSGILYEYAASDVFSMQAGLRRSEHQERLGILATTIGIRSNLVYYDQLVPYAFFGAGFYFASSPPEGDNRVNSTHFGINFGVGADLELNHKFFLGLLLSIDNLFSDRAKTPDGQEMRLTGRFSSLLLRFGFNF